MKFRVSFLPFVTDFVFFLSYVAAPIPEDRSCTPDVAKASHCETITRLDMVLLIDNSFKSGSDKDEEMFKRVMTGYVRKFVEAAKFYAENDVRIQVMTQSGSRPVSEPSVWFKLDQVSEIMAKVEEAFKDVPSDKSRLDALITEFQAKVASTLRKKVESIVLIVTRGSSDKKKLVWTNPAFFDPNDEDRNIKMFNVFYNEDESVAEELDKDLSGRDAFLYLRKYSKVSDTDVMDKGTMHMRCMCENVDRCQYVLEDYACIWKKWNNTDGETCTAFVKINHIIRPDYHNRDCPSIDNLIDFIDTSCTHLNCKEDCDKKGWNNWDRCATCETTGAVRQRLNFAASESEETPSCKKEEKCGPPCHRCDEICRPTTTAKSTSGTVGDPVEEDTLVFGVLGVILIVVAIIALIATGIIAFYVVCRARSKSPTVAGRKKVSQKKKPEKPKDKPKRRR